MNTRVPRWCRLAPVLALVAAAGTAMADPVVLAPELAGRYQAGTGVDAVFLKVHDDWQQSTVLWNQAEKQFGSGVAVSTYGWGTGLWGLADWQTANLNPTPGMIEGSWAGRVSQIAFGDDMYNTLYGAKWGSVDLAPLFGSGGPASQENWTSSFGGYIRITEAGLYNFSVLHDDGFFFRLRGAGSPALEIDNDFLNPRDALGFDQNLLLGVGLYSFELGAYDRLEAGVVELSWARNGSPWTRVPTENLVAFGDVTPVPEPGTWTLLLSGLLAVASLAARRRRRS
ncbi:MAG: PEP-CTERM sorting domain-containing protein [Burkholderiales bacterium]|nr:PEP-CTERM sorting domain-containing protein [Burkholderiales bacterium]